MDELRQRQLTRAQENMRVIRHQCPRVQRSACRRYELGKAIDKLGTITIASEDPSALYTPRDDVVECSGIVESRSSRH